MAKDTKPESKKFNLKESETRLLVFIQTQQQAVFSGVLSTIAGDRLSYPVSDHTQFKLNADLTEMELTELPVEPEPKESAIKEAK